MRVTVSLGPQSETDSRRTVSGVNGQPSNFKLSTPYLTASSKDCDCPSTHTGWRAGDDKGCNNGGLILRETVTPSKHKVHHPNL